MAPQTPAEANIWEDGILNLIRQVSEVDTFWRDQPRPAVFGPFVTLHVQEDVVDGTSETRIDYNPAAPAGMEQEPCIVEHHSITLQVVAESYDTRARFRGRDICARIRRRLDRDSSRIALGELEASIVDAGAVTSGQGTIDGRAISIGTMLVKLHAMTIESDAAFGYIETAEIVPTITDSTGADLGVPPFTVPD